MKEFLFLNGFSFPEVIDELTKEFAVKNKKGLCLYFVGLSGCGKTTIANALMTRLKEKSLPMKMTYLDGDIVRTHLSKGLGLIKLIEVSILEELVMLQVKL